MIYLVLFALGFANEYLFVLYNINAVKGKRYVCMLATLSQQMVVCAMMYLNLVDVEPKSQEQLLRWAITASSYGVATWFAVKPESK